MRTWRIVFPSANGVDFSLWRGEELAGTLHNDGMGSPLAQFIVDACNEKEQRNSVSPRLTDDDARNLQCFLNSGRSLP